MYRLLFLLWLTACQQTTEQSTSGLRIASDNYIVLTEKTLTYQADGDWEAWADMLAPNVSCYLPDQPEPLMGKAAVLKHFKTLATRQPRHSVRLHSLMHLPVQNSSKTNGGVYVVSFFRSELRYADGRSTTLRYNVCSHFDAKKRIDRLECFQSPIVASLD
ncbi:MAG: nuclear transport factor 2 family protein [Spirosomataceae bacterium]